MLCYGVRCHALLCDDLVCYVFHQFNIVFETSNEKKYDRTTQNKGDTRETIPKLPHPKIKTPSQNENISSKNKSKLSKSKQSDDEQQEEPQPENEE